MADVWLGRFSRWVEKLFNAKGGPVLFDVSPSIQPVLPLDKGVDQRYLEGWNRYGWVTTVSAVAGQFSRVRIRNPVGSNVMIVLEAITLNTGLADNPNLQWGSVTVDLTTIVTLTFSRMDPRGQSNPTAIISQTTQVAAGTPNQSRNVGAALSADFINYEAEQIPILPGNGLDVSAAVVNSTLTVNFMWRERALEQSELT